MDILTKFIDTIPKVFRPAVNQVLNALIQSLAESDELIKTQSQNAKDQIFIKTASGTSLTAGADSLGVNRPAFGLSDVDFRELIPNLSLKPKQIRKAFYDTAEVFWGPLISRANITASNSATYGLVNGDEIKVSVDGGDIQTARVNIGDLASPGFATVEEVVTILNRLEGATASVITDVTAGDEFVNLRTDTRGSVGTLTFVASSGIGASKVDFDLGETSILDQEQRFVVYHINHNELKVEIPSVVPILRDSLKGSHHFHADETLEGPVAPENGIWQGSFLFNPTGSKGVFTVTSRTAVLTTEIVKGGVVPSIDVGSTSNFDVSEGDLIFNFGLENQEVPIAFRAVPTGTSILIDPTHVFQETHPVGTVVNILESKTAYSPIITGEDLPIYFVAPAQARIVVEGILELLKAAGIIIDFIPSNPEYTYLITSPYQT